MGRGDDRFLGLAFGLGRFADANPALVIRMFQILDPGVELGRFRGEVGALGGLLLLPLGCLGEALVGILKPLPPLGLLPARSSVTLSIGGGFTSPGCGLGAFVGDSRGLGGCIVPSSFEIVFER